MPYIPNIINKNYRYHYDKVKKYFHKTGELKNNILDIEFVFILFTNRSGSNFLSQSISSSGNFNSAWEFLNFEEIEEICCQDQEVDSFRKYFSSIVMDGHINNVYFAKVSCSHLLLLRETGVLKDIFPKSKFVLIERADKLQQAASLSIAEKTGAWAKYDDDKNIAEKHSVSSQYITDIAYSIIEQNMAFEQFLTSNRARFVKITYEFLVAAPQVCLDMIGNMLNRKIQYEPENILIKKQNSFEKVLVY